VTAYSDYNLTAPGDWQLGNGPGGAGSVSVANLSTTGQTVTVRLDPYAQSKGTASESIELVGQGDTFSANTQQYQGIHIEASSYPCPIMLLISQGNNITLTVFRAAVAAGVSSSVAPSVSTLKQSVLTVGGTAVAVPSSPLAGRTTILMQSAPDNTAVIYVGSATVTADESSTGGIQIGIGQNLPVDASAAANLYAIAGASGQKLIILEGA
jgi:hypothetical protein